MRQKLSIRLAMWLVIAALVVQGVDVGYRLLVDVPAVRQQVMETLDKVVISLRPVLRVTLTQQDKSLGQASLSSFEQYPVVQSAWLLDAQGDAVAAWVRGQDSQEPPSVIEHWHEYRRTLYQDDAILGSIVMQVDPHPLEQQAVSRAWSLLYLSMSVTLLTLIMFYLITQNLITRPLHALADIVEQVNTESISDEDLDRLKRVNARGELQLLRDGFVRLLKTLNQNIASRQQALVGLRQFAETLEEKVDERTDELKQALSDVEQSGRAKTDFLSVMTHELRTPLNGILGFTALLKKGAADERTATLANNISESASKLLSIVNDMIEYVSLEGVESFTLTLFSPADAVINACMNLQKEADRKHITLTYEADVNLLMKGDGQRLSMAVRQLVSNAIKFTEQGGVSVRLAQQGDDIVLQVIDTGVGIDLKNMQGMLQAFSQGDMGLARASEGVGMGLAIVSRICQIWGAQLSFDHNQPQGTVVTIRLPVEINGGSS